MFKPFPITKYLIKNSSASRSNVKRRLFEEGIKNRECELCGQGETWCGNSMSLILDHINGINNDYRLENLRIICPNCNATLETNGGKNTSRRKSDVSCKVCGNITKNRVFCSKSCASSLPRPSKRKVIRPSPEDLLELIWSQPLIVLAKKLNVTSNAIRQWCKAYGIATPRQGYWNLKSSVVVAGE